MYRILVTDGIEKQASEKLMLNGFEVVQQFYEPEELKQAIRDFDAIVVRSATKVRQPIVDAASEAGRLKLVIRGGVGVDNIDVEYARMKGIAVRNTPNASSASVAELAIAHMFAVARFVHHANLSMREGKWNKKHYEGIELRGKTLGLIGMGRIAQETAKRAQALGMNVIYTNRSGPKAGVDYPYKTLEQILQCADFISLHIPTTADKKPLIGEKEFGMMKDGVYIINTARGGVISEEALLRALESKKVAAAALDVFEEEPTKNEKLYTHERVSVTPHIGASTLEAQERIGEEIVSILTDFFKN